MPFWIDALSIEPLYCQDYAGFGFGETGLQVNIPYAGGGYDVAGLYAGDFGVPTCGWEHFPHVAEDAMNITQDELTVCMEILETWANSYGVACI
ncbi:hypothetical protein [Paraliomyxa miuraensis]|uniref:hypothetical protein n=1 Tax=Paraliomyxa miuraensis TaxID=376150 RepID=UPI002258DE1C|nr:hypothetical protein [Paraliomyxa miuraensis]MCX4244767.1 hypothetical protein [Paraliomyxa miuraensis]